MMKAICVTPGRALEVRDIPRPEEAAPGHVLVEMIASAINHGDIDRFYTKPWKGAVLRENIREGFRLHALVHGPVAA